MKPQTVMVAGSFAQCALGVAAVVALGVGFLTALGLMVEGVCGAVEYERET